MIGWLSRVMGFIRDLAGVFVYWWLAYLFVLAAVLWIWIGIDMLLSIKMDRNMMFEVIGMIFAYLILWKTTNDRFKEARLSRQESKGDEGDGSP